MKKRFRNYFIIFMALVVSFAFTLQNNYAQEKAVSTQLAEVSSSNTNIQSVETKNSAEISQVTKLPEEKQIQNIENSGIKVDNTITSSSGISEDLNSEKTLSKEENETSNQENFDEKIDKDASISNK